MHLQEIRVVHNAHNIQKYKISRIEYITIYSR